MTALKFNFKDFWIYDVKVNPFLVIDALFFIDQSAKSVYSILEPFMRVRRQLHKHETRPLL